MEERIAAILEAEQEEISILSLLDDGERKRIAPLFRLIRYPAGTVLIEEGDWMDYIGIVASGKLEVKRHTVLDDRQITIAFLGRGAHIGDFSALRNRPAYGTVSAVEDTEVIVIGHDALEEFIGRYPATGVKILKGIAGVLAIRLQKAIEKVTHLS